MTGKAGSDTCTKTFTVTQLAKSEPTGCTAFIVDGGAWNNVPQSGASTCDSAFLYIDGIPQFTPASASSWVNIQLVHWDEDPHTYQYFCTLYTDRPCVANNLMYYAGIVPEHVACSSSEGYTPMEDLPQIVQDTITGTTQYSHALGTIRYNVAANNEGVDRSCVIRWIVDSEECPSKDFTITQLGGSGPTPTTCTYTVKSNVEGATVTWSGGTMGTTKTTTIVDGTSSISIPCAGVIRVTLTKEGCTFDDTNVKVHEGETVTIDGTCSGPTPTCTTCDDANIQGLSGGANASGGTNILIGSFSYSCDPGLTAKRVSGGNFITNMTVSNGNVYGTVVANTETTPRTEEIGIYVGTSKCAQYTLTQQGATPAACTCNSINITQPSVSFDHNSGSTKVGTIEQGCTLNVLSTSDWASLTQDGTDIIASVKENTTSSGRGTGLAYNIIGFTANTCGTVVFTQSGAPTTYNISIYGEQAETASGVKVYLAYTASPTLPSGAHFQFEDGCTLRIKYWNCNGNTEYPIVPNNHVVPNCTPGSGQEYAIESGTRVQMETLSVNFSLFGETHHLTSGGSGTYTNQGNTYIVTVQ